MAEITQRQLKFVTRENLTPQEAVAFLNSGMQIRFLGDNIIISEARTLAGLSNITEVVSVTDVYEENNTAYLIMDFLDGKNLK